MRYMMIIKANADSEAGVMPSTGMLESMGKYNEELVKAGVMLAGDGLHPSSKGARITLAGGQFLIGRCESGGRLILQLDHPTARAGLMKNLFQEQGHSSLALLEATQEQGGQGDQSRST